jgi:hypothetical protein
MRYSHRRFHGEAADCPDLNDPKVEDHYRKLRAELDKYPARTIVAIDETGKQLADTSNSNYYYSYYYYYYFLKIASKILLNHRWLREGSEKIQSYS